MANGLNQDEIDALETLLETPVVSIGRTVDTTMSNLMDITFHMESGYKVRVNANCYGGLDVLLLDE